MEGWAQPAPPGFHGAAAAMGKLEPKVLTSLVKSCVLGGSQADPSAYALGAHELQGVVNALTFVFRTATKGEVSQENFQAWLAGEGVDSERATALAAVFEQKRAATTATYRKGLTVPELSQFDWKLGVSMASSDCASLSTGFVTIQLHVKEADGSSTPHTFELSLTEFEDFAKSWAQIGQLMEAQTAED